MQNDLISRSALIAHIGDLGIDPEDDTTFLTTGQACAIAHKCIVEMVKEEPAVDAVEVIRCWECKYSELEFFADNGTTRIENYKCYNRRMCTNVLDRDDFCSCGERRADDG